jgi:hypothetical protein
MAKRNSMSTARQSRNRRVTRAHQIESREVHPSAKDSVANSTISTGPGAFAETVRVERRRLMRANAVLGCQPMSGMTIDVFRDFSIWDYDDLSFQAGAEPPQQVP